MEIHHRGERFAIGREQDRYALWHLEVGGDPIRSFPATDEGWQEAWAEFERLEGRDRPSASTTHVKAAAIIQIVLGALVLLAGSALLAGGDQLDIEEDFLLILALVTLAQGTLELLAGIQAIRHVNWGRILGVVMSAIGLIAILVQIPAAPVGLIVVLVVMLGVRGYIVWAYLAKWGPTEPSPRTAEWDPSSRW